MTLLGCALEDASSERTMHATAESLGPGLTSLETRAAAEPLDEALRAQSERVAHDLVVLGIGDGSSADVAAAALRHGDPHVLLVPPGAAAPRKILICSAPGEPGKRGVAFAGRLARHLDAAVAVLTVVPNDADETARSVAERYLAASARTLAAVGIRAATRLRTGGAADEILAEVGEGGYDLLVVGSPLPKPGSPPVLDGPVEQLVKTAGRSILIVRPTGAGA